MNMTQTEDELCMLLSVTKNSVLVFYLCSVLLKIPTVLAMKKHTQKAYIE